MNSKEMRSIAEAYASIYYPQEVDEAITSEKGKEKLKAMLADRTTASGRAKPGKGQNVKDIKHIGRANVDGLGGTPSNLKVAKNPVKSRSYGGTGNAAARREAALKREEIEFVKENVGMDSKGIMQKPEDADAKVTNDLSKPVKEIPGARPNRDKAMPKLTTGIPHGQPKTSWGEQTEDDIFDLVLEFLIQQEFASNEEEAIQIMAESLSQEDIETILFELQEDAKYDRNRKRAAQRAAARNAARAAGKTGAVPGVGYVSPRRERETYVDSAGTTRHKSGAKAS